MLFYEAELVSLDAFAKLFVLVRVFVGQGDNFQLWGICTIIFVFVLPTLNVIEFIEWLVIK